MSNIIRISGAIGLSILKNNNSIVFIFYDDHSNKNYCLKNYNAKNNYFLNEIIEKIIIKHSDSTVILEEPFINNMDHIKVLWEDTTHLTLFRKYYTKVMNKCNTNKLCYTFPVDIRLNLFDVSVEELYINLYKDKYFDDFNKTVKQYFEQLLFLFDIIDSTENNNDIIIFIKRIFDINKNFHYNKLKERIVTFYNRFLLDFIEQKIELFLKNNNNDIFIYAKGFPFENSNDDVFKDQLDKIQSAIIEFYSIILLKIKSNYKFLYFGYYHSNSICDILIKYYNYKLISSVGITDNIDSTLNINSCVHIDEKLLPTI
jgi:hypothetical protein